jgi:hypothetical protein
MYLNFTLVDFTSENEESHQKNKLAHDQERSDLTNVQSNERFSLD